MFIDKLTESPPAMATIISVIFAVFVAIVTLFVNSFWQRRGHTADEQQLKLKHTFDLLDTGIKHPSFQKADFEIHEMILEGKSADYENIGADTRMNIRLMCCYYELLAHSVAEKTCDEATVEKFRSGSMIEFYGIIKDNYLPYVRSRMRQNTQDTTKRTTIYSGFEQMAERFMAKRENQS